ncbi:MAG: ATP-binding domain-containing protein [Deltaproteobacteria bacterium]|nr:ATP-binding domain-containing protein [Deltaproteobacteria bacterium]
MAQDGTEGTLMSEVIAEEVRLLEAVLARIARTGRGTSTRPDYDAELVRLRDSVPETRTEDLPPLMEQMARVEALSMQHGRGEEAPPDAACPYFGHLGLVEGRVERDVLIGKRTFLAPEVGVRIVDWRHAPVSRIYYCYDEGDDYEETFGDEPRRGVVAKRRSVAITGGKLVRVACPDGTWARRRSEWVEVTAPAPSLSGGQGSAARAEGLGPVRGRLGVDADGVARRDKRLPEIAALIDGNQFELISSPAAGLIVVQGAAGSGKTTVGLHRIAYLAYADKERFRPSRMLVVTYNEALAAYVGKVLPALGLPGVPVTTFERWAQRQRKRHVTGLAVRYSESPPSAVSRLKKHPAMLAILSELADAEDVAASGRFEDAMSRVPDAGRVAAAWRALGKLPLGVRRVEMGVWLKGRRHAGKDAGGGLDPKTVTAAEIALARMERQVPGVYPAFAAFFTDRKALGEAFALHAPTEFSEGELDLVCSWCVAEHAALERADEDDDAPTLDREDDAILLRLHQLMQGRLRGSGGPLLHDHLMIDEVQDLSTLEVAVLVDTVAPGRPITLAGDAAQKIAPDSGFTSFEDLVADMGVQGGEVATLDVAYRSTAEIMRFAMEVLGPIAGEIPRATRSGAQVGLHRFSDPGEAVAFLASSLRDLFGREPSCNVALIARHEAQALTYYKGLARAEVERLELVADQDFSFAPGVEVTDVRQVKGLEFDYVVLLDVNEGSYPANDEARRLLHMAATRAAHQLWIVCTGVPSPLLPGWLLDEAHG